MFNLQRIAFSRQRVLRAVVASLILHLCLLVGWIRVRSNAPDRPRRKSLALTVAMPREIDLVFPGTEESSEPFQPKLILRPISSRPTHMGHEPPKVTVPIEVGPEQPPQSAKPASFFGMSIQAKSVVYVVDRSVSMGVSQSLDRAKREILESIARLPATSRFQIILYNLVATPMRASSKDGLLTPNDETVENVSKILDGILGTGGTNHVRALRRAMDFLPEVIYFVTDAESFSKDELLAVTQQNARARCVIHTLDLSGGDEVLQTLKRLAEENGGKCRLVK